jgi:hypothetical protein
MRAGWLRFTACRARSDAMLKLSEPQNKMRSGSGAAGAFDVTPYLRCAE